MNDFENVKTKAEDFYRSIVKQYCPYFKLPIAFNSEGLNHIYFKDRNKPRNVADQYTRLKLLKYAPVIINLSHTLQGKYEVFGWFRQIRYGKKESTLKRIIYYEFIAVIESYRIKVIARQLEDGVLHFWSIVPFWKKQTNIIESL